MPVSSSPPRAPPIKYTAPLGTRWAKEKAAAGGVAAFDLPTDPKQIGPWILGECVGKGASGRVKIAKHRQTGQLAAVKILPMAPLVSSRASLATQQAKSDKQRLGIDREITMMKLMNHPNIMRIYDVFEGDKELFLVLEYVEGGELFDFLVNKGRLPPTEALAYFRQIVYGLNYAHTFSIIHRDLKPENILIASIAPPVIKIADWGMAAFAPPSLQLETSCGSPHYASPEIVNGEKYQGNATDIWSCGVILYALLTGRLPFDDKNVRTLLAKVKSGKYDMPAWIDPLAKDLLGRMLVVDVHKRITVPEILSHPWLHTAIAEPGFTDASGMGLPHLPPSPSTLARPIASPSLIDPEFFSSLRVIWGRHTDPQGESIKRDLCAPAGQGVHAKAFYFLLGRYRDESLRNNSDRNRDGETCGINVGMASMKFNLGWELDPTTVNKKYDGNRNSIFSVTSAAHSRAPSPTVLPAPVFAPSMRRGVTSISGSSSSRERPPSPAGPRAPHLTGRVKTELWRVQSHVVDSGKRTAPPQNAVPASIGGPRPPPPPPRRGDTYSKPIKANDVSSIQFPQFSLPNDNVKQHRTPTAPDPVQTLDLVNKRMSSFCFAQGAPPAEWAPPTVASTRPPVIHAPIPISASKQATEMDMIVDSQVSLFTALKTTDVESTLTTDTAEAPSEALTITPIAQYPENVPHPDSSARRVSHRVFSRNHSAGQDGKDGNTVNDVARIIRGTHRVFSRSQGGKEDKENHSIGDDSGWSHIGAEDPKSDTIGLGMGRDVGRNMGNVTRLGDGTSGPKSKKEKDKKSRPPTLDFRAINQKRSALTVLGSPLMLSPPAPLSSNRLLTSPAVGEFKGWFSNLFNWKNQAHAHGGVLYSSDDVSKTRADIGRLLNGFGIFVEGGGFDKSMSPANPGGALKCRVEESNGDLGTMQTLKPVRFRVEFSVSPSSGLSFTTPNHNSALLAAPGVNPYSNSAAPSKSRNSMSMNKGGNTTPLSSPTLSTEFPPGCVSAVILIYEKGSASSFRMVWRRLKEVYGNVPNAFPVSSPVIASTPMVEYTTHLMEAA
ncbi:hypothetical protein BDZ94DRAFT_1248098 [Collybia nuda]|uniref:Protein kinase domain-containing protein n=1 Tax=Collybia nuda TaxID=64659 RepID=A0A9P5YFH1_9AGAR|nr:hypothetical protein BDZ94DRAFT_1248098 [Collybia nuda]